MVKRKGSTNGDVKSNKKVKKASTNGIDEELCKVDCTSPERTLASIVGDETTGTFFNKHWEKKPLFVKRENSSYYGNIFSLSAMKDLLSEQELNFESDVNVCRYVNGEKELLNGDGRISKEEFETLMTEQKATFQFHQPQRYSDQLWNMMEKLETFFGSLVGANVYITPGSSQGLAPHCDDVEIFVLQLEGKKTWKLYKPMVELARDYTQDLNESDIGEPFFEETLEPGDLLYFPRGTIHQAKTTDDGPSIHVSISTYQQNTWGDFMNHAVTQAIENAIEDDVTTRSGLPINYLSYLGTGRNMGKYVIHNEDKENGEEGKENGVAKNQPSNDNNKKVIEFKENIKKELAKLIDHIDVNTAADAMSLDFMASRLPPYGHDVAEDDETDRKVPDLEDKIKIKYPEHVRIVYSNEEDDEEQAEISQLDDDDEMDEEDTEDEKPAEEKPDQKPTANKSNKAKTNKSPKKSEKEDEEDEDDEDVTLGEEEPCIKIIHSLNNIREMHMCGENIGEAAGCLKLPIHFGAAAVALLQSKEAIYIKDLALDDDDDKRMLATTLYADDLIEIQS